MLFSMTPCVPGEIWEPFLAYNAPILRSNICKIQLHGAITWHKKWNASMINCMRNWDLCILTPMHMVLHRKYLFGYLVLHFKFTVNILICVCDSSFETVVFLVVEALMYRKIYSNFSALQYAKTNMNMMESDNSVNPINGMFTGPNVVL